MHRNSPHHTMLAMWVKNLRSDKMLAVISRSHNVLVRFKVSVDDTVVVQILKSKYCFRKVHPTQQNATSEHHYTYHTW